MCVVVVVAHHALSKNDEKNQQFQRFKDEI